MIKISLRLKAIADYVDDGSSVVDVGCDHGLLSIYLVESKKNITMIASDVNKNALSNALRNIKKFNMQKSISTVLSDGLVSVDMRGVDTVVISGMGAHTVVGILHNGLAKLKNVNTLIIQSNNDVDFLRRKVVKLGFYIESECLVKEQGKVYIVIKFKKGYKFYSRKQLYFGPCLLKENSALFKEKNELEQLKLKKIYSLVPKNHYRYRLKIWFKLLFYRQI